MGLLTIADARSFVQQFGRTPSGDTSVYSLNDVDRVIQSVCDDFLFVTQLTRKHATTTIADDATTFTLPTGCTPHNVIGMAVRVSGIEEPPLKIVNWEELQEQKRLLRATTYPEYVSLDDPSQCVLEQAATAELTVNVRFLQPLTASATWTIGSEAGSVTGATLNLPDEMLRTILIYGATSLLQHHEPEMLFKSESWKKYVEFRDQVAARRYGVPKIRHATRSMILES
jgi:hypothetical protein